MNTNNNNAAKNIERMFKEFAEESTPQTLIDRTLRQLYKTSLTKEFIHFHAEKGYGYHITLGGLF